jgi:hypothetical protein
MPTITDSTSTWDGIQAQEFYSEILLQGNSKSKARKLVNVKSKMNIPSMSVASLLQAGACDYSSQGTITITEKSIETCDLMVNKTICKKDFYNMWLSEQMGAGDMKEKIPATFQEYVLFKMKEYLNNEIETGIWQWDTAGSPVDLCDGWIKGFLADADVIDVANSTLSASNIITELQKVYDAIPDTIIDSEKTRILIPPSAARFYRQKIASTSVEMYMQKDVPMTFLNVQLEVVNGLPADHMVACQWENLWFATDLIEDYETIKLIDTGETLGDKNVRFVAGFKFGTGHGVGAEIVLYS